jgi:hypothetical protein
MGPATRAEYNHTYYLRVFTANELGLCVIMTSAFAASEILVRALLEKTTLSCLGIS